MMLAPIRLTRMKLKSLTEQGLLPLEEKLFQKWMSYTQELKLTLEEEQ